MPRTWNISVSEIITVLATLYLFILTLGINTFIAILYNEDHQFSVLAYFYLHRSFRIIWNPEAPKRISNKKYIVSRLVNEVMVLVVFHIV